MKFFLDTANIGEIKKYATMGIIDGVTTNPALIAMEGQDFKEVVDEICTIVDGPISAEVISTDHESMVREAQVVSKIHENIVVKIPATLDGFRALKTVAAEGIKTNFTIIYKANQALVAAKLGATYVSPFVGRLDATSTEGSMLISEIVTIYENYGFETQVLAASMRNEIYVKEAALAGAHVATIPPDVLNNMMTSELTELSLEGFLQQWHEMPKDKREYFKNL